MGSNVSALLKSKRKELGLSVKEVLNSLLLLGVDISDKTLYGWESGHRQPDADTFLALCQVYGINTFSSIKTAPPYSSEAMQLAKVFDGLDAWGKKQVRSTADIEKARCDEEASRPPTIPDNIIPFRRSIQPVSAGTGAYLGPEEFETIFVVENNLTRRASFGVTVRGNSMEPTYHDGDILIIEGAEEIDVGEIGVFTVDGEGYVKKRGEGELISLTPNYGPVRLTEATWCNGRVIGILSPSWIIEQ